MRTVRFFFAIVVSFENQRRLSESGTHHAHPVLPNEVCAHEVHPDKIR
jgi:hypothetical protein